MSCLFIFLPAQENEPKESARCHEPFGFACASWPRPDAPKRALLTAGLRQSPRLFRPQPRCLASWQWEMPKPSVENSIVSPL